MVAHLQSRASRHSNRQITDALLLPSSLPYASIGLRLSVSVLPSHRAASAMLFMESLINEFL